MHKHNHYENHDIRKHIDNFLDKYVFGTAPKLSDFEKEMRKLIRQIKIGNFRLFQIFSIIVVFVLLRNIAFFKGAWVILLIALLSAFIGLFIWSLISSSSIKKSKKYLNKALRLYRKKNYTKTLDFLLEAYKLNKNKRLWSLIINFSKNHKPNPEQQKIISELEFEKEEDRFKKDKKLSKIMQQILNVNNFITKHGEIVSNSWQKINKLKNQMQNTQDGRILKEYKSLIKRYEDIVALEQFKIEFYTKAKDELLKLKENHIITQNLAKEKEELLSLEDEILEKSIKEEYSSDMSVSDFITYENAYLEAFDEYSENISSSANQNLFEELTQSFKDKTKLL